MSPSSASLKGPRLWRARNFAPAAALAAGLALAACGQKPAADRAPEPGDKAVASVNGQTVWASDVKREAVTQGLIGEGEPLDAGSELFHETLDEVIDERLLAAEAVRRGIDKERVAQRRMTAARDRILADMLVDSAVDRAVTDQDVQAAYQEQLKRAKLTDEIRARQIIVATPAEADAVKRELAGGAAFETLAMEHSTDTATRFSGGDLGYFTTDVMPKGYGEALDAAKPGQIVGPFKVDSGYAVVRIEDRRKEQPMALDQARPQIVRFLTFEQVGVLLKRLRDHGQVKLLIGPATDVPGAPTEPASAPAVPESDTDIASDAAAAPAQTAKAGSHR